MEAIDRAEFEDGEYNAPPEVPPPFEAQLAYSQMAAELDPVSDLKLDTTEAQRHLQEVMEAAEHNETLEGDLERSHEIHKDQAAATPLASSVGQILAQIHQQTQAAHSAYGQGTMGQSSSMPASPTRFKTLAQLPPLYQRALLMGLAGGLIIIGILFVLGPLSK